MEIFVFGGSKGVGESILVKMNNTSYGIIDSFVEGENKNPRVLTYLTEKGISLDFIRFIVLTHCHHDHFTGISSLIKKCTKADFFISKAIGIGGFKMLISAYSKKVSSKHNYFREIIDCFSELKRSGRKAKMLSESSEPIYSDNGVIIKSFSPNASAEKHLLLLYQKEAKKFLSGNGIKLITQGFNFQSVVISIESQNGKILLGADQEYHPTNSNIGWEAIANNGHFAEIKFEIFKIPHHGSKNGYNSSFWKKILKNNSELVITPYSRSNLPRATMITNIKSHGNTYITSNPKTKTYKKLPGRIGKKTSHLNIRRLTKRKAGYIRSTISNRGASSTITYPDGIKL